MLKSNSINSSQQHIQIGFRIFQFIYKEMRVAQSPKTFDDFKKSQFYNAFVKFGQFVLDINCIDIEDFSNWLIFKHKVQISDWCKDETYELYVNDYVKKEDLNMAIERSIKFIQKWAEENNQEWNNFFEKNTINIIIYWIRTGRISPWLLFNCKGGRNMLDNINQEQLSLMMDILDTRIWIKKFNANKENIEYLRELLDKAGL